MRIFLCTLLALFSTLSSAESDFEALYAKLEPVLEEFKTPFSLFIFNLDTPKFALQVAENFPLATCILAGKDHVPAEANYPDNIIVLSKPLTIADLKNLIQTEHFHLLVGFNTQNIKNFNFVAKALANHYVLQEGFEVPSEIVEGKTTATVKSHWYSKKQPSFNLISRGSQMIVSISPQNENWSYNIIKPAGISLITFLALQGSHPTRQFLKDEAFSVDWCYYNGLAPWDIYVTGKRIECLPYSIESHFEDNPSLFLRGLLEQPTPAALKAYLAPQ